MSKKERMLNHITNNVKWFLSTDTSVEVIPYYDMTNAVFSRAKEYLVSGYVDQDDVVCLVSTSILEPGKSGILFTTDAMYCKSWGLFTTKYHNYYFGYEFAEFDFHNDFYEDRMKELMKDLNDISVDEDENEQRTPIFDIAKKVGPAAVLGGMALINVWAVLGDGTVARNNNTIANEMAKLANSNDPETVNAITISKKFILLTSQFVDTCEKAREEGDEISEDTCYSVISFFNDLLLELYSQTLDNVDISPENEEEYIRFSNWLGFWSLMFYDNEQFRETYPIKLLEDMPEFWDAIISIMDEILEDVWDDSFSNVVYGFAETVINNSVEMVELMADSDWDDDFLENMSKIVESNNQAVKSLRNVLDSATDYLNELLTNV